MAVANKKKKIFDGRYEVLAIVGRGAASVVYHARHAMTHSSEVALKVLLNQKGGTPSTDRLRKEALAMVSSRHKYVVRLDDFHSVQDLCYLSMEYAREGDLRKYITKRQGKLSSAQAELFFQQSAEGLNFVHRVGITHRDIKPDNILVMSDKEIRLADFGVAVLPGELASMEELRQGVGTMSYMAPEVLEGKTCDKISDIYALGVTFYEMISGVHPFENAPLIKQLEIREDQNIAPILELAPKLPKRLAEVIMRCMRYDPSHRFQSMAELLKTLGGQSGDSAKPKPTRQMEPPRRVVKPEAGKIAPSTSAARPSFSERRAASGEKSQAKAQSPARRDTATFEKKRPAEKPQPKKKIEPLPIDDSPFDFDDEMDDFDFDEVAPILEPAKNEEVPPNKAPKSETPDEIDFNELDEPEGKLSEEPQPAVTEEEESPVTSASEVQSEIEEPLETQETVSLDEPQYQEEVRDIPRPRIERRDKPIRDKPSISARKRGVSTSWIPTIVTILLVAYAGKFVISKISELSLFGGSAPEAGGPVNNATFIPPVSELVESFPVLPAGMYSGTIFGIAPGVNAPLTIISFPQSKSLAFIIGIDGWTPHTVSIEKYEKKTSPDTPKKIRVASNGMVLDLVGEVSEGMLQGNFVNAVTGEKGKWQAAPVGVDKGGKQ